jgi:hypothetical protein
MSGAIARGTNKITGMGDPTNAQDAATKNYIDVLFGSTTSAAASAAAAALSASNALTSENNASSSASPAAGTATAAAGSATAAAASYDSFDDRYLGAKSSPPSLDNDGNALITGALYFDTTANEMRVWTGTLWKATGSAVNGTAERVVYTATAAQTTFAVIYDAGYVDVYLNGVKQVQAVDFTATSGTDIVFAVGLTAGDIVDIVAYGAFVLADVYTKVQSDARYLQLAGGTMTGAITFAAGQVFPGAGDVTLDGAETLTNKTIAFGSNTLTGVQPTLVSGTSIKTVNSTTLLGSGDLAVQPTLVSGTNIKTVNSESLLGSGNISIPLTSPAGTTGQVQINSSGAFGAVSEGTTGQVLTSQGAGAAPVFATATSPVAGRLLASGDINSSTGIATLTWATTGVKRLRVMLAGANANNSGEVRIQVGHTTSVVTSSNYFFAPQMIQFSSITASNNRVENEWNFTSGTAAVGWPANMQAELGIGADGRPTFIGTLSMASDPRWYQLSGTFNTTWPTPQFQSISVRITGSATYSGRVTVIGFTE